MVISSVGELIDKLSKFNRDKEIIIGGCYGAEGDIIKIEERNIEKDVFISTDIFTG